MFAIIGMVVVLASVVGGYVLEHGNLSVLFQPVELLIIGGAAVGSFLIASPSRVVSLTIKGFSNVFSANALTKQKYIELLSLLYQLFAKIRKEGLISIEADVEDPEKSALFSKAPSVLKNHHALDFICDNFKVIVTANIPPHELDNLMEIETETLHHEEMIAPHNITKVSDSLPGLGIVAAVLGVVITMQFVDSPPAVLGHKIGAALVGTFIGILLCYGFVGPMATNLENKAQESHEYLQVIKVAIVAFIGGSAPQMAVEFGRRAIPSKEKPSFSELEKALRGQK